MVEPTQANYRLEWATGRQAISRNLWTQNIWQPIVGSWSIADLSDAQWNDVLRLLNESEPVYPSTLHTIASLLQRGVQSGSGQVPVHLLPAAKKIADKLLPYCESDADSSISEQLDWLSGAINHPSGRIFQFYIYALSYLSREKMLNPDTLEDYEGSLSWVQGGESLAAMFGCAILASQVHFLFHVDQKWTIDNVYPLLNVSLNPRKSKPAWHGYLYWGRWNDSMLQELLPLYEARFSDIAKEKVEIIRMFCSHLAAIATLSTINPLENGWLLRFVASSTASVREAWAGEIHSMIRSLDNQAKITLWQRWLNEYWKERLQGRPIPLSTLEAADAVHWAIEFDTLFPEAVDLVVKGPRPEFGHEMIYYSISESSLISKFPDQTIKLLTFLTASEQGRDVYDLDQLRSTVVKLIDLVPHNAQLKVLLDRLAQLGVPDVHLLAGKLKAEGQENKFL